MNQPDLPAIVRWTRPDGAQLAYAKLSGASPTVVFLCGYQSDMSSTKAECLQRFCEQRGQAYLRFDYQGHGQSSGAFEDGTIGTWAHDAITLIEALTEGPLLLVGSSMGGWLMLLIARYMPWRVQGLLGLAAAPDFTHDMIEPQMSAEQRTVLERYGKLEVPYDDSEGGDMFILTRALMEEAKQHLQLQAPIPLHCPLRLIHGMKDSEVPLSTAQRLLACIAADDAHLTLLKDAEHRLSRPQDLALIEHTLEGLLRAI